MNPELDLGLAAASLRHWEGREVWEGRLVAEDARIFSHVFTRDDGE